MHEILNMMFRFALICGAALVAVKSNIDALSFFIICILMQFSTVKIFKEEDDEVI